MRILALCALGELLNQQGQPQDSLPLLSEATDLASASAARPVMMRCHLTLYKANKELGQFESALLHCEHHYALKGELRGEQMNSRLRDLEVRHRTESATKEARLVQNQITELEHLNYAISHDLKGPLLTIRAFADLLGQDLGANDTSKVSGDLNWIRGAASTMQKRVSALLKLSQIRTQQSPFVIVDMHAIAQEVVDSLGGPISERGSIVEIQPNLPNVYGDTETLGHVLQNLVENALKFAKPGSIPKIEIGARDDARGVVFFVKDNGIGIKPKYHETIFHLFERLDPGVDGSGVGLALVSRIVENHDGKAWVDSAKNRGCTMCFVLGTEQIPQTAPFGPV